MKKNKMALLFPLTFILAFCPFYCSGGELFTSAGNNRCVHFTGKYSLLTPALVGLWRILCQYPRVDLRERERKGEWRGEWRRFLCYLEYCLMLVLSISWFIAVPDIYINTVDIFSLRHPGATLGGCRTERRWTEGICRFEPHPAGAA